FGPTLLNLGQKDFKPDEVDPDLTVPEADAQRRLSHTVVEARQILAGYRVNDGFGLDVSVAFDPKGKHSPGVLKALSGNGRTSNLNGLPDSDKLIAAFSAIGLERADLHMARVLSAELWRGFGNG